MKGILEHKNDINNYLKGENKMTRRVMKNNKGFSLIELLIVLAIIMVIAAIGIGLYTGLVGNTKEKADYAQGTNIAKVIQTYIIASGDETLQLTAATDVASSSGATPGVTVQGLLAAFETGFDYCNSEGVTQHYGPYLEDKSASGAAADGSEYKPQWDGHNGWTINVDKAKKTVKVVPHKTNDGTVANLGTITCN